MEIRVAATVAVFARDTGRLLLIRRAHEPFKGMWAFPGGYLEEGKEDVYQAGVRELLEETGVRVDPGDLRLLDVRSDPARDPRGHVLDVGFACMVESEEALPEKTDETFPKWVSLENANKLEYAYDHRELLVKVLELVK